MDNPCQYCKSSSWVEVPTSKFLQKTGQALTKVYCQGCGRARTRIASSAPNGLKKKDIKNAPPQRFQSGFAARSVPVVQETQQQLFGSYPGQS